LIENKRSYGKHAKGFLGTMKLRAYQPEPEYKPSAEELPFDVGDSSLESPQTTELVGDSSLESPEELAVEVQVEVDVDTDVEDISNEPISDMTEELYWAEVRLAGSIAEVERRRIGIEHEVQEHKAVVAAAEAELSKVQAEHLSLKEQHSAETDRLMLLCRKLVELTQEKKLPTEADLALEDKVEGWRLASTADLLAGVKGLSKKKLALLVEQAPNAGALEDLRALASSEHKQYHEVFPKGIGAGVAAAIEDVLCDHVAEWTKRSQDPARHKLADDLLKELRELVSEWTEADCVPKESDDEHVHAGYTAFNQGMSHTEFLSEDRAKAKQWVTGWVGAERLAKLKP
jgi:hypothetical protein